jgi:hypothetical protein
MSDQPAYTTASNWTATATDNDDPYGPLLYRECDSPSQRTGCTLTETPGSAPTLERNLNRT